MCISITMHDTCPPIWRKALLSFSQVILLRLSWGEKRLKTAYIVDTSEGLKPQIKDDGHLVFPLKCFHRDNSFYVCLKLIQVYA